MRKLNDGRSKNISRVLVTLTLGMLAIAACTQSTQGVVSSGLKGEFGSDAAATRAYVNKLHFDILGSPDSIWIAEYTCSPSPCSAKDTATTTTLVFVPSSDAQKVDWDKNLKPQAAGDVIAIVINADNHDFVGSETPNGPENLRLSPGQYAYAWVGQINEHDSTVRGFGIYKIDGTGKKTGGPWWRATLTASGKDPKILFCKFNNDPNQRKPAIHHKRSEKCEPPPKESSFSFTSVAYGAETSAMMQYPIDGDLWFSCSLGCCQITAF